MWPDFSIWPFSTKSICSRRNARNSWKIAAICLLGIDLWQQRNVGLKSCKYLEISNFVKFFYLVANCEPDEHSERFKRICYREYRERMNSE